jgi:hypothetical protein
MPLRSKLISSLTKHVQLEASRFGQRLRSLKALPQTFWSISDKMISKASWHKSISLLNKIQVLKYLCVCVRERDAMCVYICLSISVYHLIHCLVLFMTFFFFFFFCSFVEYTCIMVILLILIMSYFTRLNNTYIYIY